MGRTRKDLTGYKFKMLTVIGRTDRQASNGSYYYLCQCDCGKVKEINSSGINRSTSCGCYHSQRMSKLGKAKTLPIEESGLNSVYCTYNSTAKNRDLFFDLTKEYFYFLLKDICHYCGARPNNKSKNEYSGKIFTYNGVDRIDNTKGYTTDNVVTCCKVCNVMKNNLPHKEFIEQITKIIRKLEAKR